MAISAEDKNFLVSLYVGYFNRAPDPAGLQFWIDQVEAGRDTNTIAADFAASPEAKSLYPFLTTPDVSSPTSFITAVYANLFNRAPDAAGQAFWEQQLSSGAVSPADAIDAIIKGATTAPDSTILANKNTVGLDFATDAGNTPGFTFDLNGASGSAATSAISGVTEDASTVIAAQAATDAYLNGVAGVGETLTLTTGADNVVGTADNDTIVVSNPTGGAADTLTVGDQINGGAGVDMLKIVDGDAFTGLPVGVSINNVEEISVLAGGAITIDTTSNVTGATKLSTSNSGAAQTVTAAATTDIVVDAKAQAANAVSVNGGKDVSVSATGVTGGATTVGATTAAAGNVSVTAAGATAGATTMGAINVTGGKSVSVTTSETASTNIAHTETQSDVTVTGNANTTEVSVSQTKAAAATATAGAIANGDVDIVDANAASTTAAGTIATATINSWASTNADSSSVNSGALTTLNLSGAGNDLDVTAGGLTTAAVDTLALNLNGLTTTAAGGGDTGSLNIDADYKTLNIDSSTAASTVAALSATGAETVNVSGDAKVTFTAQTLTAVKDIVVTNTAGASFGTQLGNAVNFTGGAGADAVSLGATTKAITMGAGDDTVTYGGATGTGGSVAAGEGEDTIVMDMTEAQAADGSAVFNSTFTGFEVLQIEDGEGAGTVDLDGINGVDKVKTSGATGTQVFNNMASGGLLTLTGASAAGYTVGIDAAVASATDVLNVALENSTNNVVGFGTVTAANVETVNISTVDKGTAANTAATVDTATLVANGAKTVTVSGNNGLNLTNDAGNTAITTFDASGVVGDGTDDTAANLAVTFASNNATAAANVSITGGAGNDVLSGNAAKDTINGGAGNDDINGGLGQDNLTGGTGRDAFQFASTDGTSSDSTTAAADVVTDFGLTTTAITAANIAGENAFQAGTFGGATADILSIDLTDNVAADQSVNVEADVAGATGQAAGVTVTVKDGILTVGGAGASAVDTLGEWLVEARAVAATAGDVLAFEFGGDTYIYGENGANDMLIELDGVTGASSLVEISGATTASANSILFADIA